MSLVGQGKKIQTVQPLSFLEMYRHCHGQLLPKRFSPQAGELCLSSSLNPSITQFSVYLEFTFHAKTWCWDVALYLWLSFTLHKVVLLAAESFNRIKPYWLVWKRNNKAANAVLCFLHWFLTEQKMLQAFSMTPSTSMASHSSGEPALCSMFL